MWRCVALWAAVGLGLAAGPAAAQKQGGILRAEHIDNPPSASPLEEVTASVLVPFMSLYNNLVMFDPLVEQNSAASIRPDLAASWSPSDDGKRLTFKLHSGVKWHDGKPFSAKDVQCTWDLLLGRAEHKLRRNPRDSWWENVERVSADGELEATFHLKRPQPSLPVLLAAGWSGHCSTGNPWSPTREAPQAGMGDRPQTAGGRRAPDHLPGRTGRLLAAAREGEDGDDQQRLQRLALRRDLAEQVAAEASGTRSVSLQNRGRAEAGVVD